MVHPRTVQGNYLVLSTEALAALGLQAHTDNYLTIKAANGDAPWNIGVFVYKVPYTASYDYGECMKVATLASGAGRVWINTFMRHRGPRQFSPDADMAWKIIEREGKPALWLYDL